MGLSVNVVVIAGNLTKDIELRSTADGKSVCNIAIACNAVKRKENQPPTFVNVVAWDKTADSCAKYLGKGDGIIVTGRLSTKHWETKEGQKRSMLEVIADNIQFVTKKKTEESTATPE